MNGEDISKKILSDITVFSKYAKFDDNKGRRETWEEIIDRNKQMHIKKFPDLKENIEEAYKYVYNKKVLPSMRSLQFAGKPIEISPNRIFNCAYTPINHWKTFSEVMFLLLGGTGVGISVQKHHVDMLPTINKPSTKKSKRYLIGDSIEGWADAVKILMKSYFFGTIKIKFDFSDIREKGSPLITSGGKAPGPQPLKECLLKIEGILEQKEEGDKLKPIEAYDIMCHIADAVLAGGIRRAALITLFSVDDEEMMSSKMGKWYELNPQRGRSNNSVLVLRHRIKRPTFFEIWKKIKASGTGEPGIIFSHDKDYGVNPCAEISLRPNTFCNLTEINGDDIKNQEDFEERARAASFIGTLQASYTDFHYLRPIWQRNSEKDSLIGVSITGIASGSVLDLDLERAARVVKNENKKIAELIGINRAARTTTTKPSGSASLVLGTSSGIHAWHSQYYIRRIRLAKNESLYKFLEKFHPELVKDEFFRPHDTAVIEIPQKAPLFAITRHESVFSFLKRVKQFNLEWIRAGHRRGENFNNVSATISIKNDEWDLVGEWMWNNRDSYNGLSTIPFYENEHTHVQMPFEEIDEETYNKMYRKLKTFDITQIKEDGDYTDLSGEVACSGGACEVSYL